MITKTTKIYFAKKQLKAGQFVTNDDIDNIYDAEVVLIDHSPSLLKKSFTGTPPLEKPNMGE